MEHLVRKARMLRFDIFFNKKNAATEAHNSPAGNEIHTPAGPKKRARMKLNGIVTANWRSTDMIREFRPFPIASNTPELDQTNGRN